MAAQSSPDSLPFSVKGKTAIVTGAGSGINLAFAQLLISQNCNVVIADLSLRPEAASFVASHQLSTPSTIPSTSPSTSSSSPNKARAVFIETNVTKWSDLKRMFEFTLTEFGDFDILCPGAGVYEPNWSSFWHPPGSSQSRDDPEGDRYALLDINLTHPIRATQMALSYWLHPRTSGDGCGGKFATPKLASLQNQKRVVHISSIAGQIPVFSAAMYGASKHAINGFVRCLAPLQETGINITAVAPGVVKTPLWTDNPEKLAYVNEERDAWVAPEEVAAAMLRCVEREPGGTVLEVGKDIQRHVKALNDPGPDLRPGSGMTTSDRVEKGNQMVWDWLRDPDCWGQ